MPWNSLIRDELRALAPYPFPREAAPVKLDANESPYGLPADLQEALGRLLADVPVHRYPDPAASELRGVLSGRLGVAPEQLVFGNGSDEFITMLIQTFGKPRKTEARARVAYPVPTFVMFRIGAIAGGAAPLEVPLREDFSLDVNALERQITGARPNLLILARPNNPTGTLWDRAAIERLAELHPDLIVNVDEAYAEYAGETMIDLCARLPNVVVTRSMSKVGLAGMRLGVLIAQAEVAREIEKVRLPYNVNAFTQRAAAFLLGPHYDRLRERHEALIAERDRLFGELSGRAGVTAYPSRANFILFRVADGAAAWRHLVERGVLVRSFGAAGALAHCLRVTVGTRDEDDRFLRALDETLARAAAPAAAPVEEEEPEEKESSDEDEPAGAETT